MKGIKYLLVGMVLHVSIGAYAHYDAEIYRTIEHKLAGYDSVILYYYTPTNGGPGHIDLKGFGMKGGSVVKFNIGFKVAYSRHGAKAILSELIKKKVSRNSACDELRAIQFSSVLSLNKDSLAEPEHCNANVSDGTRRHLLLINANEHYDISCYEPEFYQHFCPTKDRGLFLGFMQNLERLLKKLN